MTIADDISRSNQALRDIVWPVIKPHVCDLLDVPDLELQMVETDTSDIATTLDTQAGIDVIAKHGHRVFPLATRVQFSGDYRTFTIRSKTAYGSQDTELRKRSEEQRCGSVGPVATIHAYTSNGRLLSAAVVRTSALLAQVNRPDVYEHTNSQDGARFVAVPWSAFLPSNIRIAIPNREEMK